MRALGRRPIQAVTPAFIYPYGEDLASLGQQEGGPVTDPHRPTSGPGGFKASRPRPGDRLYERLLDQLTEAGLPSGQEGEPVTEAEVEDLPEATQRYLRFMGVIGRPRDWSFRARFLGRFRRRPGARWMPAEAWQYNSAVEIARVFVIRVRSATVVPMVAPDT